MKKGLSIFWVFVIGVLIALIGSGAASVDVSNTYDVKGLGIIDRSLEIKTTSIVGEGQRFTESIHGSGFGIQSELNLTQNIDVVCSCNETEISIFGAMTGAEVRAKQYIRNYVLGSIQGCKVRGVTQLEYEYIAEDYTSMMHIEGENAGEVDVLVKIKDLETHKTIFLDEMGISGYTKFNIESFIENVSYPASGEEGDWLGCP